MNIKIVLNTILENKRVLLTPLIKEDIEDLWVLSQDSELSKFANKDLSIYTELEKYIESAIQQREAGTCAVWKVFDKLSGKVAGTTRIAEISLHDERGQIGWTWIGKEFQGTGLNKAMKFELLQFGFETLRLNRIEFKADERNLQSRKAMLKIGATEEGVLRQHLKLHNGYIRNSIYFSILKSEWPNVKATVFEEFLER
ncbi:GNAT family N-acetyltransferase [Pedobacter flavus]|uniref:GNAT family protein n=1 Tax=Pedobacter flavus TaxID=3113906 RepID=A0ABU7H0C6_9SPHI|nr:GNAT family protein [Pedobacter sp. VNH31]MEE1884537.1 GNAT family protein [Pedobacter sp. VNH31]